MLPYQFSDTCLSCCHNSSTAHLLLPPNMQAFVYKMTENTILSNFKKFFLIALYFVNTYYFITSMSTRYIEIFLLGDINMNEAVNKWQICPLENAIKTSSILCTLTPIRNIISFIKTKVIIRRVWGKKKKWEKTVWVEKDGQMFTLHNSETNVTPYW